jgi:hypothetical protein
MLLLRSLSGHLGVACNSVCWLAADGSDRDSPGKPRGSKGRRSGGGGGGGGGGRMHVGRQGPDAALVARFISNLANTAMLRSSSVCRELLKEHPSLLAVCPGGRGGGWPAGGRALDESRQL